MASAAMVSSPTAHGPDESYKPSSWEYVDNPAPGSPTTSQASHSQPSRPSLSSIPSGRAASSQDSSTYAGSPPVAPTKSVSPPPRTSSDAAPKSAAPPTAKWRESFSALERRDTVSSTGGEQVTVVEPTFDENVLRALCDMDVSRVRLNCTGYC